MIEIENVRKSFGPLEVLKGIDLTVAKGEVLTVIGGSGSGKSTLLTCINGLEPINGGRIVVDGIEVHAKSTNLNKLRRKIGIVFQQFNAFPHLTVLDNVTLAPRKVLGMGRAEAEAVENFQRALGEADGAAAEAHRVILVEQHDGAARLGHGASAVARARGGWSRRQ